MSAERAKEKTQEITISSEDILFECPSCGKSLVVDESAEGLIIGCPQCRTNVIVPPRQGQLGLAPPPQTARAQPPKEEYRAAPSKTHGSELPPQQRLAVLTGQLKEIQTQRTEVTHRIASRLNEVNRDLVLLARLETSQQQILSEWNQLMERIAGEQSASATGPDSSTPVVIGSSVTAAGRTRVSFRE
jgi:ssDNA-binding Zn-finger/Zn-ribbon topoisomerase 1